MNPDKITKPWPVLIRVLISAAVIALLVAALWALKRQLTHFEWSSVWASVMMTPIWKLGLALLAAIGSYAAVAAYGAITFRYAGHPLPPARASIVSFIIATFSLNLGLAVLTSNIARVRLLSAEKFSAVEIARSAIGYGALVLLAPMLLAGVALAWSPVPLPADFPIGRDTTRPLGVVLLVCSLAAVIFLVLRSRPIAYRGWQLPGPRPREILSGLFFAMLEWVCAAMILAAVFPETDLHMIQLLAVVFLAQFASVATGVPGGIGVFEVVIIALIPATDSQSELLGSILIYRVIYLLAPFVTALILFAWLECRGSAPEE